MSMELVIHSEDVFVYEDTSPIVDTVFYVLADGQAFPDDQWTDFVYPVISMWTETMLRNNSREYSKYSLPFEDGPFWLEVEQSKNDLLIKGINYRNHKTEVFQSTCTCSEFFNLLFMAFSELESIVHNNITFQEEKTKKTILSSIRHYKEAIQRCINNQ